MLISKVPLPTFALLSMTFFVAGPASGQTTTTKCAPVYGGSVSCTSTATPSLAELFSESARARAATDAKRAESLDARTTAVERFAAEQKAEKKAKQVGKLIAAGECDEARSVALQDGELDLAVKVQSLCLEVSKK